MNGRERVIKAVRKEEVDFVPAGFSCHFPKGCEYGNPAVEAHLKYFKETDTDILKIMNENLVPYSGRIEKPGDWKAIRSFSLKDEFIQRQLDLVKRILDHADGTKFIAATLHGMVASSLHPIEPFYGYDDGRRFMCECYRAGKQPVKDAFQRISEGMALLARELVRIGCDGIYYAALGGEKRLYTDEEFAELVAPLDKLILQAIKDAGGYCILHICKDRLEMSRYDGYQRFADIVNWGVYEAPMSLEDGRKMFPDAAIMGGFANRKGVIGDGSIQELKDRAKEIVRDFGKTGFVMGADCTLATELPTERVRAIVNAVREI